MKYKIALMLLLFFSVKSFSQDWLTDFEQAKRIASNKDRKIVLVFEGSDWCAPCIKLEKEIWSSTEFKILNKDHFVMVKADFPRSKKNKLPEELQDQNKKLAEIYNPNGYFPLAVVLDKNGKVLGKTGYEKTSPSLYFKKLSKF